eukprot:4107561-Prymnesium_polylepis.3
MRYEEQFCRCRADVEIDYRPSLVEIRVRARRSKELISLCERGVGRTVEWIGSGRSVEGVGSLRLQLPLVLVVNALILLQFCHAFFVVVDEYLSLGDFGIAFAEVVQPLLLLFEPFRALLQAWLSGRSALRLRNRPCNWNRPRHRDVLHRCHRRLIALCELKPPSPCRLVALCHSAVDAVAAFWAGRQVAIHRIPQFPCSTLHKAAGTLSARPVEGGHLTGVTNASFLLVARLLGHSSRSLARKGCGPRGTRVGRIRSSSSTAHGGVTSLSRSSACSLSCAPGGFCSGLSSICGSPVRTLFDGSRRVSQVFSDLPPRRPQVFRCSSDLSRQRLCASVPSLCHPHRLSARCHRTTVGTPRRLISRLRPCDSCPVSRLPRSVSKPGGAPASAVGASSNADRAACCTARCSADAVEGGLVETDAALDGNLLGKLKARQPARKVARIVHAFGDASCPARCPLGSADRPRGPALQKGGQLGASPHGGSRQVGFLHFVFRAFISCTSLLYRSASRSGRSKAAQVVNKLRQEVEEWKDDQECRHDGHHHKKVEQPTSLRNGAQQIPARGAVGACVGAVDNVLDRVDALGNAQRPRLSRHVDRCGIQPQAGHHVGGRLHRTLSDAPVGVGQRVPVDALGARELAESWKLGKQNRDRCAQTTSSCEHVVVPWYIGGQASVRK